MRSPSIPPPIRAEFPDDPFEQWLARQALNGHDKDWLRRNKGALRERWSTRGEEDLPLPETPPLKRRSRYDEL